VISSVFSSVVLFSSFLAVLPLFVQRERPTDEEVSARAATTT